MSAVEPDDDGLSMSIEALTPPQTRKLNRLRGIGGSDIHYLMMTHSMMDSDVHAPRWIADKAKAGRHGIPRGLAQRIGLAASGESTTMTRGTAREPEVLAAWLQALERGERSADHERRIDPATVQWAGALPYEWAEHADTMSPLVVHPDGWARTYDGELVTLEIKCARYGYQTPAWWRNATECPWYYAAQIQAYHAVLRSIRGILIVGCGWNRDDDDPRSDGPILALPCDRDERIVAMVRECARRSWATVPQCFRASK